VAGGSTCWGGAINWRHQGINSLREVLLVSGYYFQALPFPGGCSSGTAWCRQVSTSIRATRAANLRGNGSQQNPFHFTGKP